MFSEDLRQVRTGWASHRNHVAGRHVAFSHCSAQPGLPFYSLGKKAEQGMASASLTARAGDRMR